MGRTLAKLPGLLTRAAEARVALLHQGAGSTIDHFLRGPLECLGAHIVEIDSSVPPRAADSAELAGCALVVVVRYLERPWLAPLATLRRNGTPVVFLMDDDLLDPAAQAALPRAYRRRLWERITHLRRRLPGLVDGLWVTSDALAEKYGSLGVERLELRPHPSLLAPRPRLQLAYLGTSAHEAEIQWLLPLLETLQSRHTHTHVELFGDHDVNRSFRNLPRLRILHPMRWANYLAETGEGRIDILLTPLLASPFNATRAPVKLIDAARCGAAGLYSDRPPYRGFVQHGQDGLLLDDAPASWLAAIDRLIADPEERQRLAAGARRRARALSWPADAAATDDVP
jgi:glycosyltransferase involved in cell wall biosynthesis